jgi:Flp pilus assembly protein TadG
MKHRIQKNEQSSRDRSGMSTVEFALLLPFFALAAATVFSIGHLFYRSVCQSHAAFSAARRCAVNGGSGLAAAYVIRDYRACFMPEIPAISAGFTAGQPGICRVRIADRMISLIPSRKNRLSLIIRSGATTTATAAGTSEKMGGDNDFY